jgi:5-methylthioadenosine/S-adenosylhomocysteine deaminase
VSELSARQYRTRYHARWVLPMTTPPIADGTVVVEGDRIVYAGPRADAPPGRDEELGDSILLPGLVNAHTHLDLTVLRGFLEGLPFFLWIRTLTAVRRDVLTYDDCLDSARLGVLEGLRAGITTFADTSPSPAAFDAMRELHVRGIAYREVFGPDPAQCGASMDELRRTIRSMEAYRTPLVHIGVSPHAPYSVSDDLFAATAAYARERKLPLATHVAESAEESDLVARGDGAFAAFLLGRGIDVAPRARSPIALLERQGVLAPGTLLIHCVRVDGEDIGRIAAHDCGVAHCPASNAKLGHGVAPLAALRAAGVHVGLGSDSMASNNRMDLLDEGRLAVLAQRIHEQRDLLDAATAVELATLGGARAIGMGGIIGSLEPGKQADLAAFAAPAELGPLYDPHDALIWSLGGAGATLVVVAGRELVRDRVHVGGGLDGQVPQRVARAAARLQSWKRARDGATPTAQ